MSMGERDAEIILTRWARRGTESGYGDVHFEQNQPESFENVLSQFLADCKKRGAKKTVFFF